MRNVLVTGSRGFIGKNLVYALRRIPDLIVHCVDIDEPALMLDNCLAEADIVFHLAGVNRPDKDEDFFTGNTGLSSRVVETLLKGQRRPPVVLSSSIQAELDTPYGRSKRLAEVAIERYADAGGTGIIFRLPNVFGKWSRPNYNSVVATFCYNIARGLDVPIWNPTHILELVYIDDVVRAFSNLLNEGQPAGLRLESVGPISKIDVQKLADEIYAFGKMRSELKVPDMNDYFRRCLYSTYQSYLPEDGFAYRLTRHDDHRGSLAELLKSPHFGQIFLSRTRSGVTRGNHWHDTKVEKFCVVAGDAVIRLRHVDRNEVTEYPVRGDEFQVVDIPPGYVHSIENVGKGELVVLFWADEVFDQSRPDTYPLMITRTKE